MKLSPNGYRLLKMIDDATEWAGDERPGRTLTCFYVPKLNDGASGSGDASTFKSLERKGLIKSHAKTAAYAYEITEHGIAALVENTPDKP